MRTKSVICVEYVTQGTPANAGYTSVKPHAAWLELVIFCDREGPLHCGRTLRLHFADSKEFGDAELEFRTVGNISELTQSCNYFVVILVDGAVAHMLHNIDLGART